MEIHGARPSAKMSAVDHAGTDRPTDTSVMHGIPSWQSKTSVTGDNSMHTAGFDKNHGSIDFAQQGKMVNAGSQNRIDSASGPWNSQQAANYASQAGSGPHPSHGHAMPNPYHMMQAHHNVSSMQQKEIPGERPAFSTGSLSSFSSGQDAQGAMQSTPVSIESHAARSGVSDTRFFAGATAGQAQYHVKSHENHVSSHSDYQGNSSGALANAHDSDDGSAHVCENYYCPHPSHLRAQDDSTGDEFGTTGASKAPMCYDKADMQQQSKHPNTYAINQHQSSTSAHSINANSASGQITHVGHSEGQSPYTRGAVGVHTDPTMPTGNVFGFGTANPHAYNGANNPATAISTTTAAVATHANQHVGFGTNMHAYNGAAQGNYTAPDLGMNANASQQMAFGSNMHTYNAEYTQNTNTFSIDTSNVHAASASGFSTTNPHAYNGMGNINSAMDTNMNNTHMCIATETFHTQAQAHAQAHANNTNNSNSSSMSIAAPRTFVPSNLGIPNANPNSNSAIPNHVNSSSSSSNVGIPKVNNPTAAVPQPVTHQPVTVGFPEPAADSEGNSGDDVTLSTLMGASEALDSWKRHSWSDARGPSNMPNIHDNVGRIGGVAASSDGHVYDKNNNSNNKPQSEPGDSSNNKPQSESGDNSNNKPQSESGETNKTAQGKNIIGARSESEEAPRSALSDENAKKKGPATSCENNSSVGKMHPTSENNASVGVSNADSASATDPKSNSDSAPASNSAPASSGAQRNQATKRSSISAAAPNTLRCSASNGRSISSIKRRARMQYDEVYGGVFDNNPPSDSEWPSADGYRITVSVYLCVCVCMYVCIYVRVCVCVCAHMRTNARADTDKHTLSTHIDTYTYIHTYRRRHHSYLALSNLRSTMPNKDWYIQVVCVCVCVYTYIYIYTFIYVCMCIYVCM